MRRFLSDVRDGLATVADQLGIDGPTAAVFAWLAWVVIVMAVAQNVFHLQ